MKYNKISNKRRTISNYMVCSRRVFINGYNKDKRHIVTGKHFGINVDVSFKYSAFHKRVLGTTPIFRVKKTLKKIYKDLYRYGNDNQGRMSPQNWWNGGQET